MSKILRCATLALTTAPALLVAATLLAPVPGIAQTAGIESRIERVTVQLDRAQVVRAAEITLRQGEQQLVFADLPPSLQRSSLRLTTEVPGVAIGRPVLREVEALEPINPTTRRITATLERLERQRRIERDAVAVQELLLEVLRSSLTITAPVDVSPGDDVPGILGVIETRAKQALQQIRRAEQEIDRLDAEIDLQERRLARLGDVRMQHFELSVTVRSDRSQRASFELAYTVEQAGFRPLIEAALDVPDGSVRLAALAELSQQSGEDWENVKLALSTATARWRTAAPELGSWYIDVEPERPEPLLAQRMQSDAAPAFAEAAGIVVDDAAFDVVYRLEEPQSVASDGAVHQLDLALLDAPARLLWRTVPALDESAYLTAAFTYDGTTALLPSPVLLSRDGQPVGEGQLAGLLPDTDVELGFGVDPLVRVERRLVTDQRALSGLIGSTRRHERRYVIEATNGRAEPIELEVIDRLPISRDARITVELLAGTTPPSTTDVADAPGVLAWTRTLAPGQTLRLTFGYAIRHPAELNITGF